MRDVCGHGLGAGGGEPCARVWPEVGVITLLCEHATHALENPRVYVAGTLAKVRGHLALDLCHIDQAMTVVDLLDDPDVTGDGELLACGRRLHHCAQLLALAAHPVLLALDKDAVEAEVVAHALARESDDEATGLGPLDLLGIDEVAKQHPVVILAHVGKGRK